MEKIYFKSRSVNYTMFISTLSIGGLQFRFLVFLSAQLRINCTAFDESDWLKLANHLITIVMRHVPLIAIRMALHHMVFC